MSTERENILAGVGGTSIAFFAPTGTTMPSTAAATLNAAFADAGWVSEDGLKRASQVETTKLKAYGSGQPVRTLKTSREATFDITFMESNPTVLEIYHELPLGSLVPDAGGAFDFTEGPARTQVFSAVFDIVDGANKIRAVVPQLEVTNSREFEAKNGSGILYGVTLTAYPGGDGTAIHWYYVVAALAA